MANSYEDLKIKIFADGADLNSMLELYQKPYIKGLTTNPTLMRKAGIKDYRRFALQVLDKVTDKPISFEVFSDDLNEMVSQGREISTWGDNVNVKIPITNTRGVLTTEVVRELSKQGVKLNVTAIFTENQVERVLDCIESSSDVFISVFAGRIADTGTDPLPIMKKCLSLIHNYSGAELIWASPRELLNIIQADQIGCQIITVTSDLLAKLNLIGKDLEEFSLETVRMFREDATQSGYEI